MAKVNKNLLSMADLRSKMIALQAQQRALLESRKLDIGVLAEKAGALELDDEIIVGALMTAATDRDAAARFRECAESGKNRGRRDSTTPRERSASYRPAGAENPAVGD